MKIVANKQLCSGHARCASVAPEIFILTSDGYIAFAEKEIPMEQAPLARRGVRACPERALTFVEDQPD